MPTPAKSSQSLSDVVRKRRLQGACEECRRKKIKCDSAKRPGRICTNCEASDIQCSSVPAQRPEMRKQAAYIRILEARIKRLEGYIQALHPSEEVGDIISRAPNPAFDSPHFRLSSGLRNSDTRPSHSDQTLPEHRSNVLEEDDDLAYVELAKHISQIVITPVPETRFFGQTSPFMVVQRASALRSQITGVPDTGLDPGGYMRPIFWSKNPWEIEFVNSPEAPYVFPEDDLLINLVTLYFKKTNRLIPILHEPTFLKALTLGQHLWDSSFGMTVLLVCAIGTRYSDDPRVISVPNASAPGLSSGWHYFNQVPVHRRSLLFKSTIYDLQYFALAALFLHGTSLSPIVCNITGIGIRYAMDMGAHRRRGESQPSADHELLKRAFWALFCLDQVDNSFFGRPPAVSHEAFDVEYPIQCDDEFWEPKDSGKAFQQPNGKPSQITHFVWLIKLCEILGLASSTLFITSKKARIQAANIGRDWEIQTVAEIDSLMNEWKDSLPLHLHWDAQTQDDILQQSANLHSTFYYIQLQVHRPFMTKKSALSFSSLAMCTSAARSCASIQETAMMRGLIVLPNTVYHYSLALFLAGIITILFLWGSRRPGYVDDPQKDMDNLVKCVNVLSECEKRWHPAGALADMLKDAGALEQHQPSSSQSDELPPGSNNQMEFLDGNNFPATFVVDSELAADDWDFYRVLLSQMDANSNLGVFSNETSGNIRG